MSNLLAFTGFLIHGTDQRGAMAKVMLKLAEAKINVTAGAEPQSGRSLSVRHQSMHGSVDGLTAIDAFSDLAQIALVDLESGEVRYLDATDNGAGALGLGMTNNVCH